MPSGGFKGRAEEKGARRPITQIPGEKGGEKRGVNS